MVSTFAASSKRTHHPNVFYIEELAPRVILETILSGFWQKGNTVVHRYVGHADWVTWARPHIVVSDTSEITVLSQPEGTVVERFDRRDKVSLKSQTIRMDILRVMFPNRAYAVLLFFDSIAPPRAPHTRQHQTAFSRFQEADGSRSPFACLSGSGHRNRTSPPSGRPSRPRTARSTVSTSSVVGGRSTLIARRPLLQC